jgi:regulator of replication initiation timing
MGGVMRVAKLSSDGTKEENTHLREENEQLRHMLEERDAELAMIQSVQEGLTSKVVLMGRLANPLFFLPFPWSSSAS